MNILPCYTEKLNKKMSLIYDVNLGIFQAAQIKYHNNT